MRFNSGNLAALIVMHLYREYNIINFFFFLLILTLFKLSLGEKVKP